MRILRASSVVVPALFLAWSGCTPQPDQRAGQTYLEVDDGGLPHGFFDDGGNAWVTSDWADEPPQRLHLPGYSTLKLHHRLGRVPRSVEVYASFAPDDGLWAQQIGNVAEVLGTYEQPDGGRIRGVTEDYVIIRNAAAQEFWVIVVLR